MDGRSISIVSFLIRLTRCKMETTMNLFIKKNLFHGMMDMRIEA